MSGSVLYIMELNNSETYAVYKFRFVDITKKHQEHHKIFY